MQLMNIDSTKPSCQEIKYLTSKYRWYKVKLLRKKNKQLVNIDDTKLSCQKKDEIDKSKVYIEQINKKQIN